jgi:hypothetical protein
VGEVSSFQFQAPPEEEDLEGGEPPPSSRSSGSESQSGSSACSFSSAILGHPETGNSPNAGGVEAGSPGLARTRLPGGTRENGSAPRRRCEESPASATLPGLELHRPGVPGFRFATPGCRLQRLRRTGGGSSQMPAATDVVLPPFGVGVGIGIGVEGGWDSIPMAIPIPTPMGPGLKREDLKLRTLRQLVRTLAPPLASNLNLESSDFREACQGGRVPVVVVK